MDANRPTMATSLHAPDRDPKKKRNQTRRLLRKTLAKSMSVRWIFFGGSLGCLSDFSLSPLSPFAIFHPTGGGASTQKKCDSPRGGLDDGHRHPSTSAMNSRAEVALSGQGW